MDGQPARGPARNSQAPRQEATAAATEKARERRYCPGLPDFVKRATQALSRPWPVISWMASGTQPAATSRTVRAAEPSPTIPPHQAPQENRTAASQNAQANDLPSKSRIVAMAVPLLDLAARMRPGRIVRRLLRSPRRSDERRVG